LTSLASTV